MLVLGGGTIIGMDFPEQEAHEIFCLWVWVARRFWVQVVMLAVCVLFGSNVKIHTANQIPRIQCAGDSCF